jgi:hypothetical protein
MKYCVLLIISWLCSIVLQAQQHVVATSGNTVQNTSGSISWTLGEPVITTFSTGSKVLSQGFQQGGISVSSHVVDKTSEFKINIAPNPTSNWILLSVEQPKDLQYQLYNFNGKLLQSKSIVGLTTRIDFAGLASGSYIIKVMKGKIEMKSLMIVKQ